MKPPLLGGPQESMQYAWLLWNALLLVAWLAIYALLKNPQSKREMLSVSLWTSLLGFTEPLFVPKYWFPPSLFDLAFRTHFDLESFLFSFGIGGIISVLYESIFQANHEPFSREERHEKRHKHHLLFLLSGPIIFFALVLMTNLNPIYDACIALIAGGFFTWICRPDLKMKMITSAFLFLVFYFVFFLTLITVYPGYVQHVWRLSAISGILVAGVPLEELLFAFSIGFMWSSVYEHWTWRKVTPGCGGVKHG